MARKQTYKRLQQECRISKSVPEQEDHRPNALGKGKRGVSLITGKTDKKFLTRDFLACSLSPTAHAVDLWSDDHNA
jgi:hypothetical protein